MIAFFVLQMMGCAAIIETYMYLAKNAAATRRRFLSLLVRHV